MIIDIITFILSDVSTWTTILSLILASVHICISSEKDKLKRVDLYLSYIFFIAVGLFGLWGFVMHCFFPNIASSFIGWKNSPFQWEVGVANLGLGVAGLFAFRASIGFQKATLVFFTVFLWGAAAGHIRQMLISDNFSPGNAGAIFWTDIVVPFLLIMFLYRKQKILDSQNL